MAPICVSVLSIVVGGFLKLNSVATQLKTAQKDLSKLVEQVFKEHAAGDSYFEQEMSLPSFAFQNLNNTVRQFEDAEQASRFDFFGSADQDVLYGVATAKFYIGGRPDDCSHATQIATNHTPTTLEHPLPNFVRLHPDEVFFLAISRWEQTVLLNATA